ncbi:hypothetical protein GCM10010965_16880 [Caldalkalibacillus thermarum]|uniref:DUF2487 family protein n=1 Tax=Caldalkalibacillus thermarum TaxID=296745 RepID=UPI00166CBF0B|nr:DUF2487 family protein [Caldalkalibacillus thermarum]GGK24735.1 hypothetical protein GCM10010965_16880 [Caldalkalibacillus thermarum]
MKWDRLTIDDYLENRQYIDTALVPLIKMELGNNARLSAVQATWLSGVVNHLEEQLMGRVLLLPALTYTEAHEADMLAAYLNRYTEYVLQSGFKHQVYITVEEEWEKRREKLRGGLFYIDASEVDMEDQSSQALFDLSQKFVPSLISLWKKG